MFHLNRRFKMLKKYFFIAILLILYLQGAYAEESAKIGPKAFVPENVYEFSPIYEGKKISHDFIIQNKGDEPLIIVKIRTSCKCTMATDVHRIEPGSEEKITVTVDTAGYGGRKFIQAVSVDTNEAGNPALPLTITGQVEKFITLQPKRAILTGLYTKPITAIVRILSTEEFPFKIIEHHANTGGNIKYTLKEIENPKRSEYLLTVENTRKTQGKYFDTIQFKTDSKTNPEFIVKIMGNIYDPEHLPVRIE
jgi:hypothetical protein